MLEVSGPWKCLSLTFGEFRILEEFTVIMAWMMLIRVLLQLTTNLWAQISRSFTRRLGREPSGAYKHRDGMKSKIELGIVSP